MDQIPRPARAADRSHAVVIGAGLAGLTAARALADAYDRVTVLDRDTLPADPAPRRGVPQSRQLHVLLARGAQALEELFPGFLEELLAAGATRADTQGEVHWYLDGHLLRPAPSGVISYGASRPRVEHHVRARVEALPGVVVRERVEVLGPVTTPERDRVTGVRVRPRADGAGEAGGAGEETIPADLVVDASGRGSRAPAWLEELGYPRPRQTRVRADVVYVTRHFRREPHHLGGRSGVALVPFPGLPRGGAIVSEREDRFAVVLFGLLGEEPPADEAGMLAYAETLPGPDVAEVLRTAEPLNEPVRMRYPASARHHYEKLDRHLGGFLVTGDALCGFNPTYGQGMTAAAQQAIVLRTLLARNRDRDRGRGRSRGAGGLPRRFFRAAARVVDTPWLLAAGGDLRFPEAEGRRGPADGLLDRYLTRYRAAASVDPVLGRTFLAVAHMLQPPARLMSPGHVLRVLRASGRAGGPVRTES
ncbi:FAD-dependent oxidoreductase [Streptomyces radiopugnans]|uniref:Dehydrogenase (Flavoprotein) n=1 Tax=Streptomyces radiopugnans TaxID=403935 RepID=A0A1H9EUC4_9ACTN|nr:FAD-dependent monooxygenase [Streptomyces radiopugnans]SEQ29239.1 Dehydrogenase (flavoprotein) [Streptomyces radiopugnans]